MPVWRHSGEGWAPGVVVSVGRLTSRPWVQFPVEGGRWKGERAVDRRRVWGAREPALGCFTYRGGTADGKKWLTSRV